MVGVPQQMPTKFPCWCKAVYSWGGESKSDLGFIEGDLIECLNAGDGSWWTGRLRRDRRAIGLFPSNFVELLGEDFQPAPISRNISPMPPVNNNANVKTKGTFRKPFQAYEKVGARDGSSNNGTPEREKTKSKWTPYSSMKTAKAPTGTIKKQGSSSPIKDENVFRIPSPPARTVERMQSRAHSPAPPQARPRSPAPPQHRSHSPALPQYRSHSPAPPQYRSRSPVPPAAYGPVQSDIAMRSVSPAALRERSPAPLDYNTYPQVPNQASYQLQAREDTYDQSPERGQDFPDFRAPSPQPYHQPAYQRVPSPAFDVGSSPPPPAPPPHRTNYQTSRLPAPEPVSNMNDAAYITANDALPEMTPSPLRDAMNEVMSSLHDMSVYQSNPSQPIKRERTSDVWSPDAYNNNSDVQDQPIIRPQSSMTMAGHQRTNSTASNNSRLETSFSSNGRPQLSNYVQRMEQRLRQNRPVPVNVENIGNDELEGAYGQEVHDIPCIDEKPRADSSPNIGNEAQFQTRLIHRKSAYELGRQVLGRNFTAKTSATSSSSGWQSNATMLSTSTAATSQSLMSKSSAGAVSATSAGSLSRRRFGMGSLKSRRPLSILSSRSQSDLHDDENIERPESPVSGPSYHPSHATRSGAPTPTADWNTDPFESDGILGGLGKPKSPKKSGFFQKMLATAKTGAANARSTIGSNNGSRPSSRAGGATRKSIIGDNLGAITNTNMDSPLSSAAHRDMGLGGGTDWMQVRRDVNRSNSLSRNERQERAERCQMLDILVINPIDELMDQTEGDEGINRMPVSEPTDFQQLNLALVDKGTRFLSSLPPSITPSVLAQTYLCRPFRSDVQRLRAIFTWVTERISWEDDFIGEIDTRRVIQTKRGCSQEIATLVRDMCVAVGLQSEIVSGCLKAPGELYTIDALCKPNHWWNAVICDGEWRVMDCSLANATNTNRSRYSSASSSTADSWWFLARPMEICYTHVPTNIEQQHLSPSVAPEILLNLPCTCPTFHKNKLELVDFDTSMLHVENLEMTHLKLHVPEDIECVAEVQVRHFAKDFDGDVFESGDVVCKSAFSQAQWIGGRKMYTIKAILPGDEGQGVLNVYAGKRGLMHSIKSNPHPLAFTVPISHTGKNPAFDFHIRHPTPHAQRHDLYVAQPQCYRLVINNTFVFCVRQHPSSSSRFISDNNNTNKLEHNPSLRSHMSLGMIRPVSPNPTPNPYIRPASAMSMISAVNSITGSNYSHHSSNASSTSHQNFSSTSTGLNMSVDKPAKLALQSPSGKIIRLTRKAEYRNGTVSSSSSTFTTGNNDNVGMGSSWETAIKVGERGIWRGLVLADRSARWCVFSEWECI